MIMKSSDQLSSSIVKYTHLVLPEGNIIATLAVCYSIGGVYACLDIALLT